MQLEWAKQRKRRVNGNEVLCCSVPFPDPILLNLLKATATALRMLRTDRGRGDALPLKALGFVHNHAQALRIKQLADAYAVRAGPCLVPYGM